MIDVKEISKSYGDTLAVKDVEFTIGKGEIVGLLGPNGAGKTTLMKILTGYHYPDYGTAAIGGRSIVDEPEEIKEIIGYLPENAPLYAELTPSEYLEFIMDARLMDQSRKKNAMERAVEVCGLSSVIYKPIDQLSKGYRQRVGLAQAIIHDPEVLILDEPTTGLDPNQIIEIRKLIQELGEEKTVILSTHILREVEAVCQRVMIMNRGTIIASGTPSEISDQMRGGAQVTVRIKGDNFSGFESHLDKNPSIERIVGRKEIGSSREYIVGVTEKEAASESIFDSAVSTGMKILELKSTDLSLEDIFIELTGKEE